MRSRSLFLLVLSIAPKDVIFQSVLVIKSWEINKKATGYGMARISFRLYLLMIAFGL